MNISIFNKKYWVRRFGEPKNVRGYITSGREDFVVSLHIHPMGSDAMQALPEGERKMKHLEGHGTDVLVPANQETGVKGDLLLYRVVRMHRRPRVGSYAAVAHQLSVLPCADEQPKGGRHQGPTHGPAGCAW